MIIANYHSDEVDVHYGHGKFLCIFIRLMVDLWHTRRPCRVVFEAEASGGN